MSQLLSDLSHKKLHTVQQHETNCSKGPLDCHLLKVQGPPFSLKMCHKVIQILHGGASLLEKTCTKTVPRRGAEQQTNRRTNTKVKEHNQNNNRQAYRWHQYQDAAQQRRGHWGRIVGTQEGGRKGTFENKHLKLQKSHAKSRLVSTIAQAIEWKKTCFTSNYTQSNKEKCLDGKNQGFRCSATYRPGIENLFCNFRLVWAWITNLKERGLPLNCGHWDSVWLSVCMHKCLYLQLGKLKKPHLHAPFPIIASLFITTSINILYSVFK